MSDSTGPPLDHIRLRVADLPDRIDMTVPAMAQEILELRAVVQEIADTSSDDATVRFARRALDRGSWVEQR